MLSELRVFNCRLSKQLLIHILLISCIISIANISIQVYVDYKSEEQKIYSQINNVINVIQSALKRQLLIFNTIEIQKTLDTMAEFDSISQVQILTSNENLQSVLSQKPNRREKDVLTNHTSDSLPL